MFSKKKQKENEKQVKITLERAGWQLNFADNEYSYYDLWGTDSEGNKCLVEVKERRPNPWTTWYLEKKKVDNLNKLRGDEDVKLYLINSINEDHLLYDLDDVCKYELKTIYMNRTTLWNSNKVPKEVYSFPINININY